MLIVRCKYLSVFIDKYIYYYYHIFAKIIRVMNSLTKVQIATLFLVIAYIIWEIYVRIWSNSQPEGGGAVIRVDLLIIYPILLVLIIISIYQYFKNN